MNATLRFDGAAVTEKFCPRCKLWLSARCFHRDCNKRSGLQSYCKLCILEYAKEHREKNRERYRQRGRVADLRRSLKKRGISKKEWDNLMEAQGRACAICRHVPEPPDRLSVDHNHDTGKVRGLLCNRCNLGLGYFDDNNVRMGHALAYLERG